MLALLLSLLKPYMLCVCAIWPCSCLGHVFPLSPWNAFSCLLFLSFFCTFLLPSLLIPLPFLNPELISWALCFAVYPHSLGDCIQAQLLDMPFTLETPQVIFLAQVSPQISKFLHPTFLSHLHFKLNTCNTDPWLSSSKPLFWQCSPFQ